MLDPDQQRECREIGREIVREAMREHIASCPHGQSIKILQAKIVGVCIGCSLAAGGLVAGIARLFAGV